MHNFSTTLSAAAFILLGSFHFAGCGTTTLLSPYRDQPLAIDANTQDWMGMPMYADKNGVNISAAHDQEYLYVLVTASTQSTQSQIMRGGLTVWFDPAGGSENVIGIRYPPGVRGGHLPWDRPDLSGNAELSSGPDFRAMDMEILGPGEDERMIVSLLSEKQIQAKIANTDHTLTYELRIPLLRDTAHPYGIGYSGGGAIGIQLETPIDDSELKGRPGGNKEGMRPPGGGTPAGDGSMPEKGSPRGGGGRGPGGGRPGGGPPGGGRGDQTRADPIDIHIAVQLTRN